LSINKLALDAYWEEYLTKGGECFKSRQDFLDEEEKKIDITGCNLTCESCIEAVKKLNIEDPLVSPEEAQRRLSLCDDICNDVPYGCNNYIAAMSGDLAPNGQYGLLRKRKTKQNISSQITFDEFGDPVFEETSVSLGNMGDDGFPTGGGDDELDVNPQYYALSIYNENNSLPLQKQIKDAYSPSSIPLDICSWRKPLKISVPGFNKENSSNQILYDNSYGLKDATFTETNYRNDAGEIHFVEVYQFNDGTYSPEIVGEINGTSINTIEDIVLRESNMADKDEITLEKNNCSIRW
jgi:hypothetical protein